MLYVSIIVVYSCTYSYGLAYWALCSFLFTFSGASDEPVVFYLTRYDVCVDYRDDVSSPDYPAYL